MGIGKFNIKQIPESDVLLLESLYCLPFAKKYKKSHPNCKIISLIADTSFWNKKLTVARRLFYKLYLDSVDGFVVVSERIKDDAMKVSAKPTVVVRPFLVNKYAVKNRKFGKKLLFVGNATEEKGFAKAVEAVKSLPEFDLYLVGSCYKKISRSESKNKNIHIEGVVASLKRYFEKCTYYTHPADFDPSPVTVWEAMYAGLLPVITKNVGQAELFSGVLKRLVLLDNDPMTIASKLEELDKTSDRNKRALISACKKLASRYVENKSVPEFKRAFAKLIALS